MMVGGVNKLRFGAGMCVQDGSNCNYFISGVSSEVF